MENNVSQEVERKMEEAVNMRPSVSINTGGGQISVANVKIENPVIEAQEIAYAEKNSDYSNLSSELPSRFAFYVYNTLSSKRFGTPEVIKLAEGTDFEDFRMIVDCVSAVIDPDKSAYDLTLGDFFYLMYWLRINSFKKSIYKLRFNCQNIAHKSMIMEGALSPESLTNEIIIKKTSDLEIIYPDIEVAAKICTEVKNNYNIMLYPMTVRTFCELQDYRTKIKDFDKIIEDETKPEAAIQAAKDSKRELEHTYYMNEYASYLHPVHGETLLQKVNFLRTAKTDADLLEYIDDFISVCDHGVKETAVADCKECKAKTEINVSIDALHFFPAILRAQLIRSDV